MKKRFEIFIFCIALFILMILLHSNFVSAFGVTTIYSENYPLRMKPGETKETFFLLMNSAEGDSDVLINSELVRGIEIAEFIEQGKTYDLASGEEVEVPIIVKIPADISIGTRFKVSATFSPKPKGIGDSGNIQFIVNIGKSFPIEIVGDTENKDKDKEVFGLTFGGEQEELVEKSAPIVKDKKSFFIWIVSTLLVSIVIMGIIILMLVRRNKSLQYTEYQNYPQLQNNNFNQGENNRFRSYEKPA